MHRRGNCSPGSSRLYRRAFRRLEKPRSGEMNASGYALHSMSATFLFPYAGLSYTGLAYIKAIPRKPNGSSAHSIPFLGSRDATDEIRPGARHEHRLLLGTPTEMAIRTSATHGPMAAVYRNLYILCATAPRATTRTGPGGRRSRQTYN